MAEPFGCRHAHVPVSFSVGTRNLGKIQSVTWEWWEIGGRVSNPVVTSETFEEYTLLDPDSKNELKNVGGYLYGGPSIDGRRRADSIVERTLITLDLDKLDVPTFDALLDGSHPFCRYDFFAHTTRSHTPDKPRLRLMLLADRLIHRDEFEAVIRLLAYQIDAEMKMVDRVSWRWAQLMYWPSHSADMGHTYRFEHNEGELVAVDALLEGWDHDWHDFSKLPRDPDETDYHERQAKAENPTEKDGWVGAFCRVYDVETAIAEFELPYTPSDIPWSKPRYTFTGGSGLNGAVVEDGGLFLYSNHGTDPVSERLVNTFDLVRIHRYGELDRDAEDDLTPSKLPSFREMVKLCRSIPEVVEEHTDDRQRDPTELFEDESDGESEEPAAEDEEDLLGPPPSKPAKAKKERPADADMPLMGDDKSIQKEALEGEKTPNQLRMEQMNKLHAMALIGGKSVALTFRGDDVLFGTLAALNELYANNRVATDKSTIPLSQWWNMQPDRRAYMGGVTFEPGAKPLKNTLNLWRGFSVEPNPEGSCHLYLEHLFENVAQGNEAAYRYLIGWMADMVQNPGVKPGVAVVLKGPKGVGKDVVAVHLGQLFKRNYVPVSDMDQLTGKFNAHFERALLVHGEEVVWGGDKRADGSLKSLITRATITLERKGIDAIVIPSSLRLIVTSNEEWPVPATAGERRYAIYNVGTGRQRDTTYFAAMAKQMREGGYGALLHFLMSYDLSGFDVRRFPDTQGLADVKVAGLRGVPAFWHAILEEGALPGGSRDFPDLEAGENEWWTARQRIGTDVLYVAYKDWWNEQRGYGHGHLLEKFAFGTQLGKMVELRRERLPVKQGRGHAHGLDPLPACRAQFEEWLGSKVAWQTVSPDDEDLIG